MFLSVKENRKISVSQSWSISKHPKYLVLVLRHFFTINQSTTKIAQQVRVWNVKDDKTMIKTKYKSRTKKVKKMQAKHK